MLTKKAKYALNALISIAKNNNGDYCKLYRSEDISSNNLIPKKFLESILTELTKSGILGSKKGKNGGYFLLKKSEDILLVDIIRMFDGAIGLIPCATYKFYQPCEECLSIDSCKIRLTFKELRDINVSYLKGKSIADLI